MTSKIPIGISACLVGEPVRYDGGHKKSGLCVDCLPKLFDLVPICPEVAIGLGSPRETLNIVDVQGVSRVLGSVSQNLDVTDDLGTYANTVSLKHGQICGYVVKDKSPSCALASAKTYRDGQLVSQTSSGVFTATLHRLQPLLPMIEEPDLHDRCLRGRFLEQVVMYADWQKKVAVNPSMPRLIDFHSRNKYLVMAHSYARYKSLGQIVANAQRVDVADLCHHYFDQFMDTLSIPAEKKGHVNVLFHLMGYLKEKLPGTTRQSLVDCIDAYRRGDVDWQEPMRLMWQYVEEHGSLYIRSQTYWQLDSLFTLCDNKSPN